MIDKYVLLIEDNPDEVILTQRAFKKSDVVNQLKIVSDGRQALDFLFAQGSYSCRDINDKPGLILLDLKLPLVSGLDVLKEIRTNPDTCLIPIVILTSSSEDQDQINSFRLGANDYIRKPTGFVEFIEIVKSIKLKWLSCN
jgi:two-component system, response regulator